MPVLPQRLIFLVQEERNRQKTAKFRHNVKKITVAHLSSTTGKQELQTEKLQAVIDAVLADVEQCSEWSPRRRALFNSVVEQTFHDTLVREKIRQKKLPSAGAEMQSQSSSQLEESVSHGRSRQPVCTLFLCCTVFAHILCLQHIQAQEKNAVLKLLKLLLLGRRRG